MPAERMLNASPRESVVGAIGVSALTCMIAFHDWVFERREIGGEPHLMDIRSVMRPTPTLTTNFGAKGSGQPISLN